MPSAPPEEHADLFRLMVQAVKDYAIFRLDPDGYVSSWNEGAEYIKGYRPEEIIGQHFSVFYPPDKLAEEWPAFELQAARKEGRFEDEGWRIRKDGSRFWANVVITAIRGEDGQLLGFTKVTRDLTERRAHEEALYDVERRLQQANADLIAKNSDLQDFAHVASHDLQEPLRKIRTFAGMLITELGEGLSEDGLMYLDRICTSADRMKMLLDDLLAYSRVTTRARAPETVDLNWIVEEAVSDLHVLVHETEGRVEWKELPTVQADPTQMRQLVQNLIGNALKFRRSGVAPHVRITSRPHPGPREGYIVLVEDNGIGFEEVYAERIFGPFQRLHGRDRYAGSGLGLAICKRIVERHGGSISVHSRPGEGSTFAVYLPTRGAPVQD